MKGSRDRGLLAVSQANHNEGMGNQDPHQEAEGRNFSRREKMVTSRILRLCVPWANLAIVMSEVDVCLKMC